MDGHAVGVVDGHAVGAGGGGGVDGGGEAGGGLEASQEAALAGGALPGPGGGFESLEAVLGLKGGEGGGVGGPLR